MHLRCDIQCRIQVLPSTATNSVQERFCMGGSPRNRREAILQILSVNTKHSAREIENRLRASGLPGVTRRTLERDLTGLEEEGEIDSDNAKPRGYKRTPSKLALRRELTPSEAMVFRLAESHLSHLLPGGLEGIFSEIFNAARKTHGAADFSGTGSQATVARWPDKILVLNSGISRVSPRINPRVQSIVSEALLQEHQVQIDYWSQYRQAQSTRTVHPLGLIQRGRSLYLIAASASGDLVQTYAMHRIRRATVLEGAVATPSGFALAEWAKTDAGMQYGQKGRIDLVLSFAPHLFDFLQESPLDEKQKLSKPETGWGTLQAHVTRSIQLEQWLLSLGPDVVVIEPTELRADIQSKVIKMMALYAR